MLKLCTILIKQLDFDNLSKLILASRGYIHEQSILIECSPKAYCTKLPYEKTHVTKTTHLRLTLNKYLPFYSVVPYGM